MKFLAQLTFAEAEAERARGPIVLVPIGSTEAHGPHLPLETDVLISAAMAVRAAEALERAGDAVLIAPTIPYTLTDYAGDFAGTISISGPTARALVAEVCAALIEQGFNRVCLVNSHLEPAHVEALRQAVAIVADRTGHKVAFPDKTEKRWARTLTDEFKRGACHAGSYETSLILATNPAAVRDLRQELAENPIDLARAMREGKRTFVEAGAPKAYFGNPAGASRAEGEATYALLVEMIVRVVRETWP